ncbi:MAG: hypothetical protein Tsb005_20460 [Gammaproteobacteria bacterium]
MHDDVVFRGMAGEVVNSYLRPKIFLTAIPIFIFWVLCGIILFFLSKFIPSIILSIIMLIAWTYLIARFAIPASYGQFTQSFFSEYINCSEVLGYLLRYIVLMLGWSVPIIIIGWLAVTGLANDLSMVANSDGIKPLSIVTSGFHGFLLLLLMVIALFAPTLSLIIALYADSVRETLSLDTWRWLLCERRSDLIPFLSHLVGGFMVFWMVYLIPIILLTVLMATIAQSIATVLAFLGYLMPMLTSPVLIGRLVGAFVASEAEWEHSEQQGPSTSSTHNSNNQSNLNMMSQTTMDNLPVNIDINLLIAEIDDINETQLAAAERKAAAKLGINQHDIVAGINLAYIKQRRGDIDAALKAAVHVVNYALIHKLTHCAVRLVKDFTRHQIQSHLTAKQLLQLSEILMAEQCYVDASWCIYFSIQSAEESIEQQKALLAIADKASQAGDPKQAYSIYNFFVRKYPHSSLNAYARSAADAEKAKIRH